MLWLIAIASAKNQSTPITQNLDARLLDPHFETVVHIRLFGFSSSALQNALTAVLGRDFMRANVTAYDALLLASPHHSFSATAQFLDLPNTSADPEALVRAHFNENPTTVAVYVVRSEDPVRVGPPAFARGPNWMAIRFCDSEKGLTDQATAYRILSRISDLLHSSVHPLWFKPRVSVRNNSAKIIVYQPPPLNAFNVVSILKRSIGKLADVEISAVEFDTDCVLVICSLCPGVWCIATWLQRLPEFARAEESNAIAIFLLRERFTYDFGYFGLGVAPTNSQRSLEAVAWAALFGWNINAASESFSEIIARRNMAIGPILELTDQLRAPLLELEELRQFSAEVLSEKLIQRLDAAYGEFITLRNRYLKRVLEEGIEETQAEFRELENLTGAIVEQWALVSENVQMKRVCVGNLRDLTYHPFIFMRPSFYCLLSVIGSLVMWRIILTLMKPKEVLGIWQEAEPLL
jgi:hypothetical protein